MKEREEEARCFFDRVQLESEATRGARVAVASLKVAAGPHWR